jgi:peptidoglycan L-alanyl-D-glutamate endopeptidase CwlK
MPKFGKRSRERLHTLDPRLQDVLNEAIEEYDFSVLHGYRGMESQNNLYNMGFSKLRFPNSKHNSYPSRAVDIIPYPGGYNNPNAFFDRMATYVLAAASRQGVRLVWGGHWENFPDYAHFELKDD